MSSADARTPDSPKPKAEGAVRIVSWNTLQGLHSKLPRVRDELEADVAVLCEVGTEGRLRKAGENEFRSMDWVGRLQNRGLAVMGFGAWRTKMYDKEWDPRLEFVLPAKAKGPRKQAFNVIGCWAMNHRAKFDPDPERRFSQGAQIPSIYPSVVAEPTVIAGDFNNCLVWDEPGKSTNWQVTVDAMSNIGLKSAYHSFTDEAQGEESQPTLWFKRSTERTFHIDHCFVPRSWDITQVWVGGPDEWLRKGDGSDHAPLVVDVVPD